ncbi:MAG: type II toxin-antitoxin system HicA family toxin [Acidobacteriota bacterium]|nr:type II toxin-antitoxin system HicA family toxin [Acidobacteriota bacterium]
MKRADLLRHLLAKGCELLREGGNHSIYVNRVAHKVSTIPRHREIDEYLARKICRDLEVPEF